MRGLRGNYKSFDPQPDLDHANVGKYTVSFTTDIPILVYLWFFYASRSPKKELSYYDQIFQRDYKKIASVL